MFNSLFPTFLTKCGELHTLLLSVAFALFIVGVIVSVHHRSSHRAIMHLLIRILVLTALLVFLPQWGNAMQTLLQNSILNGLDVDPAHVCRQYYELLAVKISDNTSDPSWWDVVGQIRSMTTNLLVTAVLWIVAWVAYFLIWWAYIFQKIILNLGYALSPLLVGFMAIPALKHIGNRYLLNLVGVLLWPLGWAVAALVTQGILDFMTDQSFLTVDPTAQLYNFQNLIGLAVAAFWIIFSTIAAPLVIQKVVTSGVLGGAELLSGATTSAIQTATAAVSGTVAAAPYQSAGLTAAAAGSAGMLTLFSSAGGMGYAGSIVAAATGLGPRAGAGKDNDNKNDLTGERAVRQMLAQTRDHFGEPPPMSPKAG
jgi:hypothetical protein